jgi:hypothetical protein
MAFFIKKKHKHHFKLVWIDTITDQLLFECCRNKCTQRWRVGRSELYMYLMFPREWPG